jgi:hypothetical protein
MKRSIAYITLMMAGLCLFPSGVYASDGVVRVRNEYLHDQPVGSMTVEAILHTDFGALQIPLGFDDDRVVIDSVTFLMSIPGLQTYMINAESQVKIAIIPYLNPIPSGGLCEVHFHIPDDVSYVYAKLDTVTFVDNDGFIHELEGWDVEGLNLLDLDFQPGDLFFEGPVSYICGDFNLDYTVDLNDVLDFVNYIFGNPEKSWPRPPGDSNCDYELDFLDIIYLVNYLFRGGPEPCESCR